jgi:uncharacterized protein (DUF4213/DUF364 family)
MKKSHLILKDILAALKSDHDVSEILTCVFWTAVCSLRCGIASTMAFSFKPSEGPQVESAGHLLPSGARALAQLSLSPRILERAIGLAAINSVIPIHESLCENLNAEEEIRSLGTGKKIAVIGHFPFVKRLRESAKELWVFELPGRGRPGDLIGREIETLLPQADVVAISSTTLLNHTLGKILGLTAPAAVKILLGPGTPLSPVLFDHGLDILSGSLVKERHSALECISQGANFRQILGVQKVTMRRTKSTTRHSGD